MSISQPVNPNDQLPISLTSFVGREREVAAVCALLRQDVRLLTLIGPGGTGKTRLAIEVTKALRPEFADEVCFVPLAPISDPEFVVPTVAYALGLRDRGARTPWADLIAHLREKHFLLVLDNFEHVSKAAPLLTDLLAACSSLSVLVTSRAVLRLSIEHEYAVSPLELPEQTRFKSIDQISSTAAVSLFVSRAKAARPDFEVTEENAQTIVEICRRLDGLPLAIELAAARVRYLVPGALLERIQRRLPLLGDGPRDQPERLRTMRDAIAWSYDLLDGSLQRLFRCLSIFVGGFSIEAAEVVVRGTYRSQDSRPGPLAASDAGMASQVEPRAHTTNRGQDEQHLTFTGIGTLVDESLLQVKTQDDGNVRFEMLETIREFGLEQLVASGEAEVAHRAHAAWCIELAEQTEPELHGPAQHRWCQLMETEHGNLRAALTWLDRSGDVETFLRLATVLASFWWFGGHLRVGSGWLGRALAYADAAPVLLRARALEAAGFLAQSQADDERAVALLERSLAIYREIADARGIAGTLYSLGVAAEDRGAYDHATAYLTESAALSEELGDHRTKTFALLHLGIVSYGRGDFRTAVAQSEAGIALARAINSTLGVILGTFCLALVATDRGEFAHAAALYREIVDWMDAAGIFGDAWLRRSGDMAGRTLAALATLAVGSGQLQLAARMFGAAAADNEAIGQTPALPERIPFERAIDVARGRLGDTAFQAASSAGRGLTPIEVRTDIEAVLTRASEWPADRETSPVAAAGLTPREQDILRLLVEGRTNKEIAATLYISDHTVMGHVANILAKLDVPNRAAAVNYALRHSLL